MRTELLSKNKSYIIGSRLPFVSASVMPAILGAVWCWVYGYEFHIFNALLVRVEIYSIKEDIFFGNIVTELDGKVIKIDSRSSDAIALAIRAHIPIMVSKDVMDKAAIVPEKDIQEVEQEGEESGAEPVEPPVPTTPEEEERLSIFDDFLENLDSDDASDEEKTDDKPGPDKK